MTIKNIDAQVWLDEKYPLDGKCKRGADPENKGIGRELILNLNIEKDKVDSGKKTLRGDLQLENFSNLKSLNISNHNLNSLNVSKCLKLEILNVSGNENIESLDLSKNVKLMEINVKNCKSLKIEKIFSHLKFDEKLSKLVEESKIETIISPVSPADEKVRNILIIGMTGSGKSALANTLTDTNDFKSGNQSISLTKYFKSSEEFNWEFSDKQYKFKVIDNIGFGDTKGEDFTDQLLYRIGEGIKEIEGEVNQILFLIKGRLDPFQIKMFEMFKSFINESEITQFTTIVRTNFPKFKDSIECEKDKEMLLKESGKIRNLIESCNNNILYIDNPGFDNDEIENKSINIRKRKKTREIILNHLAENCNQVYKMKEWKSIKEQVSNCLSNVKEINDRIKESNDQSRIESLRREKKSTFLNFFSNLGKIRAEKINVKGALGFNVGVVTGNLEVNVENLGIRENNYSELIEQQQR